jgi:hypothetical protein
MTPEELRIVAANGPFGHLEVVALRLKARYGHMPFYQERERTDGFEIWRALAASAWNLDGLADEVAALRQEGKL